MNAASVLLLGVSSLFFEGRGSWITSDSVSKGGSLSILGGSSVVPHSAASRVSVVVCNSLVPSEHSSLLSSEGAGTFPEVLPPFIYGQRKER